jgi:hypothetical protein
VRLCGQSFKFSKNDLWLATRGANFRAIIHDLEGRLMFSMIAAIMKRDFTCMIAGPARVEADIRRIARPGI